MKYLVFASALLMASAVAAADAAPTCSIHPKKGATKAEITAMAKVTQADAEKAALASLADATNATVRDAELEVERGCLIYSFDIAIAGKKGFEEIHIDAGDGKVLAREHETPRAERKEHDD